jgi:hypothetical protein
MKYWGAILAIVTIALGVLLPVIMQPSAAEDVLLHGSTGLGLALGIVTVALLIIAKRRIATQSVVQKGNHSPRASVGLVIAVVGIICGAVFSIIIFTVISGYRTDVAIQRNGQRVMADVVRIYDGGCGKRGCSINVEYRFTPQNVGHGSGNQVHGYGYLGNSRNQSNPELDFAQSNHVVPVAYDVTNPSVSELNFDDWVFKVDHAAATWRGIRDLVILFAGMFVVVLSLIAFVSVRGKRDTGLGAG